MNRGERRDINKRKWLSRLKLWFNREKWKGEEMSTNNGGEKVFIENVQDFQKTHYAHRMKKSDTIPAPKKLTEKALRTKNINNRKLSNEDREDADNLINE